MQDSDKSSNNEGISNDGKAGTKSEFDFFQEANYPRLALGGKRIKTKKEYSPKVSIVSINLNNADGLRKTIESIVNQNFESFELVIIDGGSKDSSLDIIREYEDKIELWVCDQGRGIYNSMNLGIKLARGEWINFMNSGDQFYSNTTLSDFLDRDVDADLIWGRQFKNFGKEDSEIWKNAKKKYLISSADEYDNDGNCLVKWWNQNAKLEDLWQRMIFSHQSVFFRNKLIQDGYNEVYRIVADYELIFRLYCDGAKFELIEKPVAILEHGGLSDEQFLLRTRERYLIVRKYMKGLRIHIHYRSMLFSYYLAEPINMIIKYVLNKFKKISVLEKIIRKVFPVKIK